MTDEHRPNTNTPPNEDSVFSRVMNTRVAQTDREPVGQVAAVVTFKRDVTLSEAVELLAGLGRRLESTDVQAFKPQYGMPVLFFP